MGNIPIQCFVAVAEDYEGTIQDLRDKLAKAVAEREVLATLLSNMKIDDGDNPTERWCPKEYSGTCMRCYIVDPGEDEWCEQGIDDNNCWLAWADLRRALTHNADFSYAVLDGVSK